MPRTLERERRQRERTAANEFKVFWGQINDIYEQFVGRAATRQEAQRIFRSGISSVGLQRALAKRPSFYRSPLWQSKSRDYIGIAREMGMKADRKLIATAIVNNWDGQSFAEKLREMPGYLNSNEFKTSEAGIANIYRSIYGEPDEQNKLVIREMAMGRWKPDQAAAAFRDAPEYRNSAEYQSKAYRLQQMLGFLPTQSAQPPPLINTPRPRVPNSPRIQGNPNA